MPLFYSHTIDDDTRLAVWHIREPESFFLDKVPASRTITHWHKRLQHLAGRYLLQHLFPDFPLQLIQIATTKKPYLPEESHHFSISHCGDYAAAMVSTTTRVGIDIEAPVPKMQLLAPKFMSTEESDALQSDLADPTTLLTMIWSAKESMFKWYSHGAVDFRRHMVVEAIRSTSDHAYNIEAGFLKHQHQPLQLEGRLFDGLVLTWLADG